MVAAADPCVVHTAQWDVVLGRGAFKTVYKGFDEEEGIEVAWNRVRVSELVQSKEERDRLFAEIRVLKQLKHKNIMTFYDSWLDSKCAPGSSCWGTASLHFLLCIKTTCECGADESACAAGMGASTSLRSCSRLGLCASASPTKHSHLRQAVVAASCWCG